MKKLLCAIALGAICLGTASASVPDKAVQDTVKSKTKYTHKHIKQKTKFRHGKIKAKMKDTTKH
jgi:hypothetical protein